MHQTLDFKKMYFCPSFSRLEEILYQSTGYNYSEYDKEMFSNECKFTKKLKAYWYTSIVQRVEKMRHLEI